MKENRFRKIQMKFWVTEDEESKIINRAKKANMKKGRFLRNAALKSNIIIFDWSSILELSAQISHIGNNINQIAKKLNQGEKLQNNDMDYLKNIMSSINETIYNLYQDVNKHLEDD